MPLQSKCAVTNTSRHVHMQDNIMQGEARQPRASINVFKEAALKAGKVQNIANGWSEEATAESKFSQKLSQKLSQRTSKSFQRVMSKITHQKMGKREVQELMLTKIMGAVIVLNALMMAAELDFGPEDGAPLRDRVFWFTVESIFLVLFLIELLIRIYWERLTWVRSWWNWLDLLVISVGMLESWVLLIVSDGGSQLRMVTLLRIVRLVRLLRVLKLVRTFRTFYATVCAFRDAIQSMTHILTIMIAGIFLCSIFTTATIGRSDDLRELDMGPANGKERFGTIPRSMYSLFELMTLEGWEEMGRPLVMTEPFMGIFLFIFIMVFAFGLMNMIIAVVVEKTLLQAKLMESDKKVESLEDGVQELFAMKDSFEKTDGTLTMHTFKENLSTKGSKIAECLKKSHIPIEDEEKLFSILDVDLDGDISFEELLTGCARIYGASDSLAFEVLAIQADLRSLQRSMKILSSEMRSFSNNNGIRDGNGSCKSMSVQPPPLVHDVQPPQMPPAQLPCSRCVPPSSPRQVNFSVVPGEVQLDNTVEQAADNKDAFVGSDSIDQVVAFELEKSSLIPKAGLLTSMEADAKTNVAMQDLAFKVDGASHLHSSSQSRPPTEQVVAFKVEKVMQTSKAELPKTMEANAKTNACPDDVHAQLLARLDSSLAKQEELVKKLTSVEDFFTNTVRQSLSLM